MNYYVFINNQCYIFLHQEEQDQNKELDYVLKRTIRGLGAMNHKTKEINYCLLTSHLSMSNNVTAEKILQIMEHELHPSASNGKSVRQFSKTKIKN